MTAAAVADPTAREFLRNADPVLARLIDAHPDFHPRAWIDELPGLVDGPLDYDGRYRVSGNSFFQANRFLVDRLGETALDGASGESALDRNPIATSWTSAASRRAQARPMPRLAPVITAVPSPAGAGVIPAPERLPHPWRG